MFEIAFIAYILSLISIVLNIWFWFELKELKQQQKRRIIQKRLDSIVQSVKTQKPKGIWG